MPKRPTSITIICWFYIICTPFSVLGMVFMINDPKVVDMMKMNTLPLEAQYAMILANVFVMLTTCIAMLKGQKWGRTVFVGWTVFHFILAAFTAPAKLMLIPSVILAGIIFFFLYRPAATQFFVSE